MKNHHISYCGDCNKDIFTFIKKFEEQHLEINDGFPMSKRLPELDILRGIAVLLVLGRHILIIPEAIPQPIKGIFLVWQQVGWVGVDLFFVLSGFLVSGLLFAEYQKTGKIRITRFLVRRGFKIYPSFYVFLIVSAVLSYFFAIPPLSTHTPVTKGFLGEAIFLQNYLGSVWNHTWSLAVEEHFYLFLAMLVVSSLLNKHEEKDPFGFIKNIFGVIAIFLLLLRVLVSCRYPAGEWIAILPYSHYRLDSLCWGALISYYYHFKRQILGEIVRRYWHLLSLLVLIAVVSPLLFPLNTSRFMYSVGFTLLYFGFGAALLLSLFYQFSGKECFIRFLSPLGRVGIDSYSIYLWHMAIYYISLRIFPIGTDALSFYVQAMLYMLGSIVVGSVMARTIEFPVLRLRERFFVG